MRKKSKFFIIIVIFVILTSLALTPKLSSTTVYANQFLSRNYIYTSIRKESINVDGGKRTFLIYIPSGYQRETTPLPVVMVFHGMLANSKMIMNYTKYNLLAEKYNFIAVYPQKSTWYDWDLKTMGKNKEVGFVNKLIDYMIINYKIDKSRIYGTGYSSGADLCMLLACKLPDKFAAFATVDGSMKKSFISDGSPQKPVPILMINGTNDFFNKWKGGGDRLSVNDSIKFWKNFNKCEANQQETLFPHKNNRNNHTTAKLIKNNNCQDNTEVSLLEIDRGGHTWPGEQYPYLFLKPFEGRTNFDVKANDIIFEFFNRHILK